MLSLDDLAALFDAHRDSFDASVEPFHIGARRFDTDGEPVLMGVVNLSRDSTYRESIAPTRADAVRRARILFEQGAHVVDIGAESSRADASRTSIATQIDSLIPVVSELADAGIPTSVESYEVAVIKAGLQAGAAVVNLTGTQDEDEIFHAVAEHSASLILCFTPGHTVRDEISVQIHADPVPPLLEHFAPRLQRAREAGVASVALDPGLGFFYGAGVDPILKAQHQAQVLVHSFRLRPLGVPICQIMPHAFDLFQEEFRTAEGVFTVIARLGRVGILRVHEVPRVRASLRMMDTIGVQLPDTSD